MHLFRASDWPSVRGWYAMLIAKVVPCKWLSSCQKLCKKRGSRSVTIDLARPWSQMIPTTKASATDCAVKEDGKAMKCPYFDSRSTTVMIVDLPLEPGKHVIKSIAISSNNIEGMGRGWSSPAGRWWESSFVGRFGKQPQNSEHPSSCPSNKN